MLESGGERPAPDRSEAEAGASVEPRPRAGPSRSGLYAKLVRGMAITMSLACLAIVSVVGMQSMWVARGQLARTEALLSESLDQKGTLLTENHGLALRSMVEANAFGEVDSLVKKAVAEDDQVIYGLFLDSEGNPWSLHGPGIEDPDEWTRLGVDPEQAEAEQREVWRFGRQIREYSFPVLLEDEVVGTIRYGLSTAALQSALDAERTESIDGVRHTLSMIVIVGVIAAVMGIVLMSQRSRAITEPLAELTDAAHRVGEGEKGVRAEVTSGDELELLAGSFNDMVSDLEASYGKLQAFSQGLEKAVAERTQELRVKTDDVRRMLDNIEQGVFTLLPDLSLHREYSANLEVILERGYLGGESFEDQFLARSDLGTSALASARFVLSESFGNLGFFFLCNRHLLPHEFTLTTARGTPKLLELEYVGIEDDEENLERVLVIVRDVTELRALRQEADAQREALQVVGELLAVSPGEATQFFERSFAFLDTNRSTILAHPEADPETLAALFRNMHTLKGNARLLGFQRLNDVVHDAEELYRSLRRGESRWDPEALLANGEGVRAAVRHYADVFEQKLSRGDGDGGAISVDELSTLLEAARSRTLTPEQVFGALETKLYEATTSSLPEALGGAVRQLPALAKQLGKEPPDVRFLGDEPRILPDDASVLQDVFVHVLRNCIDHGIEAASDRTRAGKPATGTVTIHTSDRDGQLTFRVRDDGAGLPIRRFREQLGDPAAPLEEVAEVPFQSGVSTAREVTSVSGRGVGMDAVRQFLRARGGRARIEIDAVPPHAERAPFTLVLVCPRASPPVLQTA